MFTILILIVATNLGVETKQSVQNLLGFGVAEYLEDLTSDSFIENLF